MLRAMSPATDRPDDEVAMNAPATLFAVLPAYNEERSLPRLLERYVTLHRTLGAAGMPLRVIVVDDGSTDGTIAAANAFASRLSLEILPHGVNRNLGAALRTGLTGAAERAGEHDYISTMDADNTHDPGLLVEMLRRMELAKADLVIASRYAPGGREVGLTPLRRVLSRGASFMLSAVAPVRGARDYTCGFRLYRASLLRKALRLWGDDLVEEAGFTCMAEVLLKLGRGGARVAEAPLELRYDLKEGASKMKVLRTIGRYFVMARRIRTRTVHRLDTPGL
jgi:dolichol-phosphate mannosyltransferase